MKPTKTRSTPRVLMNLLALLALFAAGSVVRSALALPLPDAVVGLVLVLLGLRVAAIAAAVREAAVAPAAPAAEAHGPLRAAG